MQVPLGETAFLLVTQHFDDYCQTLRRVLTREEADSTAALRGGSPRHVFCLMTWQSCYSGAVLRSRCFSTRPEPFVGKCYSPYICTSLCGGIPPLTPDFSSRRRARGRSKRNISRRDGPRQERPARRRERARVVPIQRTV